MLYTLPALLITVTFHELAHGFTAYKLGDPTAKEMGRLTLNPLKHIDPLGFLTLLIFHFGWAKPVPINPNYFKNRKQGTFLVSLAGPLSNFILGYISLVLLYTVGDSNSFISYTLQWVLLYNIMFGIFNLLPVPPLDGSKLLASLLPDKFEQLFWNYERYGYIVLIILIFTNVVDYILQPASTFALNSMITTINMIVNLFS